LPTDHQSFFLDLGELPSSTNPDEFGFRGIEFQPDFIQDSISDTQANRRMAAGWQK